MARFSVGASRIDSYPTAAHGVFTATVPRLWYVCCSFFLRICDPSLHLRFFVATGCTTAYFGHCLFPYVMFASSDTCCLVFLSPWKGRRGAFFWFLLVYNLPSVRLILFIFSLSIFGRPDSSRTSSCPVKCLLLSNYSFCNSLIRIYTVR